MIPKRLVFCLDEEDPWRAADKKKCSPSTDNETDEGGAECAVNERHFTCTALPRALWRWRGEGGKTGLLSLRGSGTERYKNPGAGTVPGAPPAMPTREKRVRTNIGRRA